MSNHDAQSPTTARSTRRRALLVAAIVGTVIVSAALLTSLAEAGSGWLGMRHGHGHGGEGFDVERASEHAEFATSWMLRRIDASDEQETRIQEIVAAAIGDLAGLKGAHGEQHEAFLALLADEKVDREKLEQLRTEQIAMAETASTLLAGALADIADTLSVEQRAALIEQAERHRGGRGWRH